MGIDKRSAFQQQVVEALLDTKAIDLKALGAAMSKYGERAAREGETLVQIINRPFILACGWPGPEVDISRGLGARSQPE